MCFAVNSSKHAHTPTCYEYSLILGKEGLTQVTESKGQNNNHYLSTVLLSRSQKQFGLTQRDSPMIDSTCKTVIADNGGLDYEHSIIRAFVKLAASFMKLECISDMNQTPMLSLVFHHIHKFENTFSFS